MTPRVMVIGAAVVAFAFAGGCASGGRDAQQLVKVADPGPTGPLLLAEFDNGVGAVAAGSPTPAWTESGGVAALDSSAVFSIRPGEAAGRDQLVRIDPHTGAVTASWSLPAPGLSISAVAPGGRWVALTDRRRGYGSQGRASTKVVVFDTRGGVQVHQLALTGDVQPEAFSVDGARLFVLDYRVAYYRVQTIDLVTGARYDTIDRDKTIPPEDMHGTSVHGVLSADRTLLATLYRNPGDDKEPAFVHVLDLEHGYSYCADLPAPFGTGPLGSDSIELTKADTVVVANRSGRLAEVHIEDVHTPPDKPVRLQIRNGTVTPPSPTLQSIPGFEYVIAPLDA